MHRRSFIAQAFMAVAAAAAAVLPVKASKPLPVAVSNEAAKNSLPEPALLLGRIASELKAIDQRLVIYATKSGRAIWPTWNPQTATPSGTEIIFIGIMAEPTEQRFWSRTEYVMSANYNMDSALDTAHKLMLIVTMQDMVRTPPQIFGSTAHRGSL